MERFDLMVFWHALFLAFVYCCLAMGATAYRQILDNIRIKEADLTRLGEDIYFCYDPLMAYWIAAFAALAVLFFFIGYVWSAEAYIERYVVPLAFLINIAQISYRMKQQRLRVRTFGFVGRSVMAEDFHTVLFAQIHLVEACKDPVWSTLILYYAAESDLEARGEVRRLKRRMTKRALAKTLATLRQKTDAKILTSGEPLF